MDHHRFDTLTRALTTAGSRRRALAGLISGMLGLVLGASFIDVAGAKKKCPPCKKRKNGKCKKKLPDGTACPGGTCQNGSCIASTLPGPTCSDRLKNGSESDVDCGGSCSRCANGKSCISRRDCIGALCINNVCTSCSAIGNECFSDAHGACECRNGSIGPVCNSSEPLAESVSSCAACPPGTTTCSVEVTTVFCWGPCGGV